MQIFFSSLTFIKHFTHSLQSLTLENTCKHCFKNDQWVSHGYVYKQRSIEQNLILFGQPELLHYLSLSTNKDIKSRITYSATIKRLNDDDMERYIVKE